MVRKLSLQGSSGMVDPQMVNEDPDAEISSWTPDGKRTVCYTAALNVPALVRRFIGTDVLRISEIQQYERCGNCFIIRSDPVVEGPAGELFSTNGNILLEPSKSGTGCLITMNVFLHCKTAVTRGAVEAFMEMKATKSFEEWMEVVTQFCREKPALACTSLMPCKTSEETLSSDGSFYDLEEGADVENPTSIVSNESVDPREFAEPVEVGVTGRVDYDASFAQAVSQQLSGLRSLNEESRAHIERLDVELQSCMGSSGSWGNHCLPGCNWTCLHHITQVT